MQKLLAITVLATLVATGSAFSGPGTASAAADNPRACYAAFNMALVGPPDTLVYPYPWNEGMVHAMTIDNPNGNVGMNTHATTSISNQTQTPLGCTGQVP